MKNMFKFLKGFVFALFVLSSVAYAGSGNEEMINTMFGLAVLYFLLHGCELNFKGLKHK